MGRIKSASVVKSIPVGSGLLHADLVPVAASITAKSAVVKIALMIGKVLQVNE